jgi:hypothetical protein
MFRLGFNTFPKGDQSRTVRWKWLTLSGSGWAKIITVRLLRLFLQDQRALIIGLCAEVRLMMRRMTTAQRDAPTFLPKYHANFYRISNYF